MTSVRWSVGAIGMALLGGAAFACSSSNADSMCGALSACCQELAGTEAQDCQSAIEGSGETEAECGQALQQFQTAGYCGGNAADRDGGGVEGGPAKGNGCSALRACCPELPVSEDPTECLTVAGEGTTEACIESLATYQADGYCLPPDGGSDAMVTADGSKKSCDGGSVFSNTACGACLKDDCGDEWTNFDAECASFVACLDACDCEFGRNGGPEAGSCVSHCLSTATEGCEPAIETLSECEESTCKSECGVDGGT
jgi:hypothetical protein